MFQRPLRRNSEMSELGVDNKICLFKKWQIAKREGRAENADGTKFPTWMLGPSWRTVTWCCCRWQGSLFNFMSWQTKNNYWNFTKFTHFTEHKYNLSVITSLNVSKTVLIRQKRLCCLYRLYQKWILKKI